MASGTSNKSSLERLKQIDSIEQDIVSALTNAGNAIQELSKDKIVMKNVESNTANFLKTIEHIESELSEQINYLTQVSTGQPHEGSSYAAQKDEQMSVHRLEHTRTRLKELEALQHLSGPQEPATLNRSTSETLLPRSAPHAQGLPPQTSGLTPQQQRVMQPNVGAMRKSFSHMDQR